MKRKSGIQTSEDMREDLECPVCLKIPRSTPIYQCDKGHIHCKTCHPRLRKCPICRAAIGDTRSLMTEKVISRLPTRCAFHENGCNVPEDLPPEMTQHELGCYFRTVKCTVKNCKDTFVVSEVLKHFAAKHPAIEPKNSSYHSVTKYSKFVEPPERNSSWPPLLLQANGRQFMVTRRQDTSGYFAMRVYIFGSNDEVTDYSCTIKAHNKSNNTKLFAMDSSVHPIDEKNVAPNMTLHIRQIQEMMNENKQIIFEINIRHSTEEPKYILCEEVNDNSIQNGSKLKKREKLTFLDNGPKHKRQKITFLDNLDY